MSVSGSTEAGEIAFLSGGGEVGAMMRAHDWSRSPLGPPTGWPQSLRSVVGLMLGSKFPMFVAWGQDLGFLYNDAYVEVLGAKHPQALGQRFFDIWSEIWPDISPLIEAALAGEATYRHDLPLLMNRKGYDEQTWFTFSYSPVRDERGQVAGMFCACQETTERILAERKLADETERQRQMFEQAPGFICTLSGPEHVFDFVNHTYVQLFGPRDYVGRTVRETFPELVGQGFYELLDEVYATGRRHVAHSAGARLMQPDGTAADLILDFIYEPITDPGGTVVGVFCLGHDVTETYRVQQALRESEEDYRYAAELNPQVAWTAGPDGLLDRVAHRWMEWTGASGLGSTYADGLHPDDVQRTFDVWSGSVASGEPYDIVHRVKRTSGEFRWARSRAFPRRDQAGQILRWYGATEDIHEQKVAEDHLRLMVLELNHRVKNNLATVQAIAVQTLRGAETPEQAREAFLSRITALSAAHDILTRKQWEGVGLGEVAHGVLDALTGPTERVRLQGPPVKLEPRFALSLSMAFHELGTNALKYGALSRPEGRVEIDWSIAPGGDLELAWRER
ncbi:MAG TPA: PAS domain-containing protein, partial [Phenylobacterium sp.]